MVRIEEDKKPMKYEFGCVMLYFDFPAIYKIQDAINPKHLYEEDDDDSFGLEDNPHTTLLFGLHENVTTKQVKEILDNYVFGKCTVDTPSLFENENYDVFKFDVLGNSIFECNEELRTLPHTNDFPEYHPHLTIAYLQKGFGERYVRMLEDNNGFSFKVMPKYAVYSMANGVKIQIPIKFG